MNDFSIMILFDSRRSLIKAEIPSTIIRAVWVARSSGLVIILMLNPARLSHF